MCVFRRVSHKNIFKSFASLYRLERGKKASKRELHLSLFIQKANIMTSLFLVCGTERNFASLGENLKICDLIFHLEEDFFIAFEIKGAFDSDITHSFSFLFR